VCASVRVCVCVFVCVLLVCVYVGGWVGGCACHQWSLLCFVQKLKMIPETLVCVCGCVRVRVCVCLCYERSLL